MADEQRCTDTITLMHRYEGIGTVMVPVTCQRLVVTANGVKVEHIHHRRDLDIPGCVRARVSWTRRR
jgi:hypothetical protein